MGRSAVCRRRTAAVQFRLRRKSSGEFLSGCKLKVKTGSADAARKQEVRTYTDPASGLEVRCEIVRYADYPAVEWVVYFKNNGRTKTGILENLLPLDVPFGLDGKDDVYLNYNEGGHSGRRISSRTG